VTAHRRSVNEQEVDRERMPIAYREAVKQYMIEQHRREPKGP
jgi:hypothetical protein